MARPNSGPPASKAAACATFASSAGSTRRWKIAGGIDAVYFEEVRRHVGTDAAHVFGGLPRHADGLVRGAGHPYQGVPVGTMKRYATGKGNADKQAVIAAIRERGFEPADDNEADAIAILLWAIETRGGWHERSAEMFLKHAANVVAERRGQYGDASTAMAALAARWSVDARPARHPGAGRPLPDRPEARAPRA